MWRTVGLCGCTRAYSISLHVYQQPSGPTGDMVTFLNRALVERWSQTAEQKGTCQTEVNRKHRWAQICHMYKNILSTKYVNK